MQEKFNIFYFISIYKKCWIIILCIVLISMSLGMISSLLKPPVYISKLTLITKEGRSGSDSSTLGNLLGFMPSYSNDIIVTILNSKRMSKAINDKLELEKSPEFWWNINTFRVSAGLGIIVKGSDPELVQKVANFSVESLDIINQELNITPTKPMVTVLDPANYGYPQSKDPVRKTIIAGMFAFFVSSIYIFLLDYLRRLKKA